MHATLKNISCFGFAPAVDFSKPKYVDTIVIGVIVVGRLVRLPVFDGLLTFFSTMKLDEASRVYKDSLMRYASRKFFFFFLGLLSLCHTYNIDRVWLRLCH